jgi:hypothetical protein
VNTDITAPKIAALHRGPKNEMAIFYEKAVNISIVFK